MQVATTGREDGRWLLQGIFLDMDEVRRHGLYGDHQLVSDLVVAESGGG